MNFEYETAVKTLTSQGKFHICLGLDRVKKVLELLSNPQNKLKIIHVAGTNGKGSVSTILSDILIKAGYRVGTYTSPHLIDYTERIKISGIDIPQKLFAKYVSEICSISQKNNIHLTEFEILTVGMYQYFFDEKVDIVVVETGLGGRLDATNAIESSILDIITSISIDHKDRLGDTIEKIAFEKAGIIKTNSKVIISPDNKGYNVISTQAQKLNATIYTPQTPVSIAFENNTNYAIFKNKKYKFNLLGLFQAKNLELALCAIKTLCESGYKITEDNIKDTLNSVSWAGRMQFIQEKNIIIDGAHNEDGAKNLIKSLDYYFPNMKRRWIYGSLITKDYEKITKILFKNEDEIFLCEFDYPNSLKEKNLKSALCNKIVTIRLPEAENMLTNFDENYITIITGSLYLIGNLLKSSNL